MNEHLYLETSPFEGTYKTILQNLFANSWSIIIYLVVSVSIVYLLGYVENLAVLFVAFQLPTIAACSYVTWSNPYLRFRLPINWLATAALALFIYLHNSPDSYIAKTTISNLIGVIGWFFSLYWLAHGLIWTAKVGRRNRQLERSEFIEFIADLLAIWGMTLLIASILNLLIGQSMQDILSGAFFGNALLEAINLVTATSVLRFVPLGFISIGLLIIVALRLRDVPYHPKEIRQLFPERGQGGMLALQNLLMILYIPIWMVIVIVGFIIHFSELLWETSRSFIQDYLNRLWFAVISLVLGPMLFYLGHLLTLQSMHLIVTYTATASHGLFQDLVIFLVDNLLILLALTLYIFSVPPMGVRFRGENSWAMLGMSLYAELFSRGINTVTAVGQTFALFGIVPFAIPLTALLPGGPTFGFFHMAYLVIVILCFVGYRLWIKKVFNLKPLAYVLSHIKFKSRQN